MPSPALFVFAHPDDEVLAASVALTEHLAASPGQDIHILWLTKGTASGTRGHLNGTGTSSWWGVQHDPAAEGYAALTVGEFGDARIREGKTAVRCLAAGLPGTLTFHVADLIDGSVGQADAYDVILDVADEIAPGGPVRIKTHSHLVDDNADHRAAGLAARQLKVDDPGRFTDLRHYILPPYWADSRLSQVTESWDLPAGPDVTRRVLNAIRAYGAWAPPETYAIGQQSVPSMFATLQATPKSLMHT